MFRDEVGTDEIIHVRECVLSGRSAGVSVKDIGHATSGGQVRIRDIVWKDIDIPYHKKWRDQEERQSHDLVCLRVKSPPFQAGEWNRSGESRSQDC